MKIFKFFQLLFVLVKLLMLLVKLVNLRRLLDSKHILALFCLLTEKGIKNVKNTIQIFEFRAELAVEEYIPVSETILENIIILKKNPDYKPDVEKPRKKTSL